MLKKNLALTLLLAAASLNAKADGAAQIYTQGNWISVQTEQDLDAFKASTFFTGNPISRAGFLAQKFLENNSGLLNLGSRTKLIATERYSGPELETIRYQKLHQGVEVVGGESLVHLNNNQIEFANMDSTDLSNVDMRAALSADEAAAIALSAYNGHAAQTAPATLKILLLDDRADEASTGYLTYAIKVLDTDGLTNETHYVDAHTGRDLLSISNILTLKSRKVYSASGTNSDFDLDENLSSFPLVTSDSGCGSTPVAGAPKVCAPSSSASILNAAKAAMNNSGLVYDYYLSKHGRRGIDNKDSQIKSVVNFGDNWPNAAWVQENSIMVYGTGDHLKLNDFSVALDVAAHELTHGITGGTAKLVYAAEPGALNESYSDVFGKLVAFGAKRGSDWKLGKELFKSSDGFVRDMENPKVGNNKDFKYRGQLCHQFNDFCGVHDNSGIPSKAAVSISKALGNDKLGKIYYLTLTQLLRPKSSFKEAANQTVQACKKLLGAASKDCVVVGSAFKTVGML